MIAAKQIRAGRALIEWSQEDLAKASGVSRPTIKRMETKGPGQSTAANVDAVQKALESQGVIFIEDGLASQNGGPGVRSSGD